jgi:CheY-like chemotaxis protein
MSSSSQVEILIVEDNPHDLEMTMRGLQKARLVNHVHVARDGEEALDFVFCEGAHAGRAMSDQPKMILLDLKLPKIDGLEVLARLKADPRTRSIPVVMLTSSQEQSDLLASYQNGVNSYIVKPVNFEAFVQAVAELGMYWMMLNEPPETNA